MTTDPHTIPPLVTPRVAAISTYMAWSCIEISLEFVFAALPMSRPENSQLYAITRIGRGDETRSIHSQVVKKAHFPNCIELSVSTTGAKSRTSVKISRSKGGGTNFHIAGCKMYREAKAVATWLLSLIKSVIAIAHSMVASGTPLFTSVPQTGPVRTYFDLLREEDEISLGPKSAIDRVRETFEKESWLSSRSRVRKEMKAEDLMVMLFVQHNSFRVNNICSQKDLVRFRDFLISAGQAYVLYDPMVSTYLTLKLKVVDGEISKFHVLKNGCVKMWTKSAASGDVCYRQFCSLVSEFNDLGDGLDSEQ